MSHARKLNLIQKIKCILLKRPKIYKLHLFAGKYIQMMRLLKPIAFDVMTCMAQLFDFYLYTVYNFFGSELVSILFIEC